MGKHSGKDEGIDPNSPQGVQIREEIPIDISDERFQQDIDIINEAYGDK